MLLYINLMILCLLLNVTQSRWTALKAWQWYRSHQWGAGVNYIPSYAVNEIEMWESLNLDRISEQLSWANRIGFSKLRVFLHIQPYIDSKEAFLTNISKFLIITKAKKLGVIFVLFDDCWNQNFNSGKQPDPIIGIHNSQGVMCPGDQNISEETLKQYLTDIMSKFKNDSGVLMWDIYNQIGSQNRFIKSFPLFQKAFSWARQVNPSQPLTSCFWSDGLQLMTINEFIFKNVDIVSFHSYANTTITNELINKMKIHQRPVICTEYLGRTVESQFKTHLPLFKKEGIWAISWGFVFGRSQAYYPIKSYEGAPVPQIWYSDVVYPNGKPFDQSEQDLIQNITKINFRKSIRIEQ